MNILVLGRFLPVPARGGREQHLARHLGRHHRVTLAFTTAEADFAGAISALRDEFDDIEFAIVPHGWKCLSSALSLAAGDSCTLTYFRSGALKTRLAQRMGESRFDMVHVSSSSMIQYAMELDATIPLVMDFGNVDSEWWLQQARVRQFPGSRFFRTEGSRLRAAEAAIARRAARCVVASAHAAEILRSFAPWAPVSIVPDGVAMDAQRPDVARPSWETAACALSTVIDAIAARHRVPASSGASARVVASEVTISPPSRPGVDWPLTAPRVRGNP